jgi:hypothetical protein
MTKRVLGKRVYVTFLTDGTVAFHPARCIGERYSMMSKGSVHRGKHLTAEEIGKIVLQVRDRCGLS